MKKIVSVPVSSESARFYDDLMTGKERRGLWGKDTRFNPLRVAGMASVDRFYTRIVSPYVTGLHRVLDFGCGPGSFLLPLSSMCAEVIGVDISYNFVRTANETAARLGLKNVRALHVPPSELPFEDDSFDAILLVDVLHHLEAPDDTLERLLRVLKPGGRLLIFEPNNFNPLLTFIHIFDRNEWGIFRLGTPAKYRKLLSRYVSVEEIQFNGIIIGPQSRIFDQVARILNHPRLFPYLGWLNPKMFIVGRKAIV